MQEKLMETPFKLKYLSLKALDMIPIRDKILKECDISKDTFYKWLNTPSKIRKPAKEKIAQIFNCNESELFPNEPFN